MDADWGELVPQPEYKVKLEEDIPIMARDGTMSSTDVYRPNAEGKFPSLLANRRSSEPIRTKVSERGVVVF
jgi:predicted acyl esterase